MTQRRRSGRLSARPFAVWVVATAACVVLGGGAAVALLAPSSGASITGLKASPGSISQFASTVTISATTSSATTCVLSSSPKLAGLPYSGACTSSYSHALAIPPNSGGTIKWDFTLTASGSHSASASVKVTQAADDATISASWGAGSQLNTTQGEPTAISCGSASQCEVVDAHGYATSAQGDVVALDTRALTGVSCIADGDCVAVDDAGAAATFDGTNWTNPSTIDGDGFVAVSCAETSGTGIFCVAIDTAGRADRYDGTSWSGPTTIDTVAPLTAVTCTSTEFCVAVDALGDAVRYASSTWGSPVAVDADGLSGVSCASSTSCVAVDGNGRASAYDGSSWLVAVHVDGSAALSGVSCTLDVGDTDCVATGTSGSAVTDTDGTWSSPATIDAGGTIVGVSCTSDSACRAVDTSGKLLTLLGSAWGAASLDVAPGSFDAVSCASSTRCVTVSDSGDYSIYNGSNWSAPNSTRSSDLISVSCSGSFCAAGAANGTILTLNGGTWTGPTTVSSYPITAISCVSATFCMAVDDYGNYATWNGTHWSGLSNANPLSGLGFGGVSCVSTKLCVLTDQWDSFVVWRSGAKPVDQWADTAGDDLRGVSCQSDVTCYAVDAFGNIPVLSMSSGLKVKITAITNSTGYEAISCSTTFFCGIVDAAGRFFNVLNSTVQPAQVLDPSGSLVSIGCSDDGYCAAIGSQNEAYVGRIS